MIVGVHSPVLVTVPVAVGLAFLFMFVIGRMWVLVGM